jgi:hypothetical protein
MTDAQFRLHNTQVVVLKRILDYLVSVNEGNKEPVAELKAGIGREIRGGQGRAQRDGDSKNTTPRLKGTV